MIKYYLIKVNGRDEHIEDFLENLRLDRNIRSIGFQSFNDDVWNKFCRGYIKPWTFLGWSSDIYR